MLAFFIISALLFIGFGIYFLSAKFEKEMEQLSDNENRKKSNVISGKICGYVSFVISVISLISGILNITISEMSHFLLIFDMSVIIAGFGIIYAFIKTDKK